MPSTAISPTAPALQRAANAGSSPFASLSRTGATGIVPAGRHRSSPTEPPSIVRPSAPSVAPSQAYAVAVRIAAVLRPLLPSIASTPCRHPAIASDRDLISGFKELSE
ncbi:ATP synthase gamma chain [Striga asiatica]|uniref:ATP synthase gamma chain n=1 Tax=Striga asiatica TaxID=4170 RepID=A0A5A7Q4D7_STRAF|nr:ATP synthase gamma chain [Striga asiatica]